MIRWYRFYEVRAKYSLLATGLLILGVLLYEGWSLIVKAIQKLVILS